MNWPEVLREVAIRHVCTLSELHDFVYVIDMSYIEQSEEWKIAIVELYATLKDLGYNSTRLKLNLHLILDTLYAKRLMEETVLQDMENMEVLEEIRLIREE